MNARAEDRGLVPPTRPANFGPPDFLRTIVTNPRATMRWVLDHGDRGLWVLLLLAALMTFAVGSYRVAKTLLGPSYGPSFFAYGILLRGVELAVFSLLAMLAARLLGGVGRWGETLRALAWGLVPVIATLPLEIVQVFLGPSRAPVLSLVLQGIGSVASAGSWLLAVFTLAEAHRLPWWRSAIALVVPTAFVGLVLLSVYVRSHGGR